MEKVSKFFLLFSIVFFFAIIAVRAQTYLDFSNGDLFNKVRPFDLVEIDVEYRVNFEDGSQIYIDENLFNSLKLKDPVNPVNNGYKMTYAERLPIYKEIEHQLLENEYYYIGGDVSSTTELYLVNYKGNLIEMTWEDILLLE